MAKKLDSVSLVNESLKDSSFHFKIHKFSHCTSVQLAKISEFFKENSSSLKLSRFSVSNSNLKLSFGTTKEISL
jgi:hypothetical protein